MPAAVFLPAYHDDDHLADVVEQARRLNPRGLKLYANHIEQRLAWLPKMPARPGWMLIFDIDKTEAA